MYSISRCEVDNYQLLKFLIVRNNSAITGDTQSGLSAAAERRRRRVILPRRTPPIHPGVHRRTACIF